MKTLLTLFCLTGALCFAQQTSPQDMKGMNMPAHDMSQTAGPGLRERKKRITRQLISDTATAMFLEKGFEEVRVADVASACNVSEKTVYNYFPTKESLLFDRFEDMEAQVRVALGPGAAGS